ncbi:MAG TPA: NAD(P)H-hydrate dehydratase, partial [Treponemataceae bacterium]|nr:NAD(P)H-hydrate dehydratase [Treponemataceae bacterium]
DGERSFVNPTGSSALAKAGSGDVLTGMIAGLLAGGCSPIDAARAGVYLHGLAGEIAARELTEYGVLASDLSRFIPRALGETLALLR